MIQLVYSNIKIILDDIIIKITYRFIRSFDIIVL